MRGKWIIGIAALAVLAVGSLVLAPDALAQLSASSPMSSVVSKTNETREMLVTLGKAGVGVVAAVLFLMALGGKVAWHWVIMVIVAGAGLTGLDSLVGWINS